MKKMLFLCVICSSFVFFAKPPVIPRSEGDCWMASSLQILLNMPEVIESWLNARAKFLQPGLASLRSKHPIFDRFLNLSVVGVGDLSYKDFYEKVWESLKSGDGLYNNIVPANTLLYGSVAAVSFLYILLGMRVKESVNNLFAEKSAFVSCMPGMFYTGALLDKKVSAYAFIRSSGIDMKTCPVDGRWPLYIVVLASSDTSGKKICSDGFDAHPFLFTWDKKFSAQYDVVGFLVAPYKGHFNSFIYDQQEKTWYFCDDVLPDVYDIGKWSKKKIFPGDFYTTAYSLESLKEENTCFRPDEAYVVAVLYKKRVDAIESLADDLMALSCALSVGK